MIRRVETENSVWFFDPDQKQYVRLARTERPTHTDVAYLDPDRWEPYEDMHDVQSPFGRKLCVHRPVPWGTGARRETGPIVYDTADLFPEQQTPAKACVRVAIVMEERSCDVR